MKNTYSYIYIEERKPESHEILAVSEVVSQLPDEAKATVASVAERIHRMMQSSSLADLHPSRVRDHEDIHRSVAAKEIANVLTLANALFAADELPVESPQGDGGTDRWVKRLVSLSTKHPSGLSQAGVPHCIACEPEHTDDERETDEIHTLVDTLFQRPVLSRVTGRRSADAMLFAACEKERRAILREMAHKHDNSPRTHDELLSFHDIESERDRDLSSIERERVELTQEMMEADLTEIATAERFEARKKEIEHKRDAVLRLYAARVTALHKKRGGDEVLERRLHALEKKQEHLLQRQSFRKSYSYYPL